jgi:hypothetical protein
MPCTEGSMLLVCVGVYMYIYLHMCVWCRVVGGSVYNNEACIRFHQALTSRDHMVRLIDAYIPICRMWRLGLALLQAQSSLNPCT